MKYGKTSMTFESSGRVIRDAFGSDRFTEPVEPSIVVYSSTGSKVIKVTNAEAIEFANDQIAMWTDWKKQFA